MTIYHTDDEFFSEFGENEVDDIIIDVPEKKESRISKLLQNVTGLVKSTVAKDEPNEYENEEWVEEFNQKSKTLGEYFERSTPEDLYIALRRKLKFQCKLLVETDPDNPDIKIKFSCRFDELEDMINKYDTIFLYTQWFRDKKFDYSTNEIKWGSREIADMLKLNCFVVDVDEISSATIGGVIQRILGCPILPNYIVNTGNGLHLYFLFDKTHDFFTATAYMGYRTGTKREDNFDPYIWIKQGLISWYKGLSVVSDERNHLAQPSRLFGSKTKNKNVRTQVFYVCDKRFSIQYIGDLHGVSLPSVDTIKQHATKNIKEYKERMKNEVTEVTSTSLENFLDDISLDDAQSKPNSMLIETENEDTGSVNSSTTTRLKFNWDSITEQVCAEKDASRNDRVYLWQLEQIESRKRHYASDKYAQMTRTQKKGYESQYRQFKQLMMCGVHVNIRRDCLHIFWNRAPWYGADSGTILSDFYELVFHCNSLSKRKVTKKQIDEIVSGRHYDYAKETIFQKVGIEIVFENNKEIERERARKAHESKWKKIMAISEILLTDNVKMSGNALTKELNNHNVEICAKTIYASPEIKELRERIAQSQSMT